MAIANPFQIDVTRHVSDGHYGFVVEVAGVYWRPIARAFEIGSQTE